MSVDRREVLKILGGGAALAPFGLQAADARAVSFARPEGWDFPAVDEWLPFGHGVASGDPTASELVLWTRLSIPDARGWQASAPQGIRSVDVSWVIATDPALDNVVARGDVQTTEETDFTVKVIATGLESATTYWYAFAALGRTSIVGRTRTAPKPGDAVEALRIASVSCGSYWKGWFNAYGRIADRNDLDLLVHLGDHLYTEGSGKQGMVRLAPGTDDDVYKYEHVDNANWTQSITHCRRRYALIGSDPDVLRAQAALPLFLMPDDNDTHGRDSRKNKFADAGLSHAEAAEQFWLWRPSRPVLADGSGRMVAAPGHNVNLNLNPPKGDAARLMYKDLPYGDLAHLASIDIRRNAEGEEREGRAAISEEHWAMMARVAQQATNATWCVWANQSLMSQAGPGNDTTLIDTLDIVGLSAWFDGDNRARFLQTLRDAGASANVVLTGDVHSWVLSELVEDNTLPAYVPHTGLGNAGAPLGVEFMTGCIASGTLQRNLANDAYKETQGDDPHNDPQFWSNYMPAVAPATIAAETAITAGTPNNAYFQSRSEGYGIIHLSHEQCLMELWEVPVNEPSSEQNLFAQFSTEPGVNNLSPVLLPAASEGSRQSQAIGEPTLARAFSSAAPNTARSSASGAMGLVGVAAAAILALRQRTQAGKQDAVD